MPGFDESSARRISRSVLYTERQQGIPSTDPNDNYGALQGSSICLVKTGSVLPTGYDGSQAVLGNVIERQADGTDLNIGQVWIKDLNGGSLASGTTYQARMAGTWAQDLTISGVTTKTTLGYYLVQKGGGGGSSGLSVGQVVSGNIGLNYNGSAVVLYYYNQQGWTISFTLIDVSTKDWRINTVRRYATATVVDPIAQTAKISFYSPIVFRKECKKLKQGLITTNDIYNIPVIDLMDLSELYPQYSVFNGLLYDMGQPGFDPVLGMITPIGWDYRYGSNTNPFVPSSLTSGISSGISPGISGV